MEIERELKTINDKLNYLTAKTEKYESISDIDKEAIHEIRYCVKKTKFDLDMKEIKEKIENNKKMQANLEEELQYLYNEKQAIEHRYYN